MMVVMMVMMMTMMMIQDEGSWCLPLWLWWRRMPWLFRSYVCMSVWLAVWLHVCMYVCMSVCLYDCMSVCLYVCMSACLCFCMHVCMHAWMCVCTYVCLYVRMYFCACMYVCAHVYTGTDVYRLHNVGKLGIMTIRISALDKLTKTTCQGHLCTVFPRWQKYAARPCNWVSVPS